MFDLNKDPGDGNTNLRAYIASVVGPRRVAHGARRMYTLRSDRPILIGQNNAAERECVYLQCWVAGAALAGLGGAGALVLFADSEDASSTGQLVNLATGFPGQLNNGYSAILLPQDQLYAQIFANAALGVLPEIKVVVAQVTF